MKKFLAVLCATMVMATSAFAGQAILIRNNGVIVYDNTRNSEDFRHYNENKRLPYGYKRVCNMKYKKHDFRNRDCVRLPANFKGKYYNPYEYRNNHGPYHHYQRDMYNGR